MTPPPVSTDPAALSAKEVAEILSSHSQLLNLMNQLLEKANAQPPASASLPAASVAVSAPQSLGAFVPQVAAVGINGSEI
ncbi:hypothetical protein C0992_007387 [Termitomyces sp. T32_za158]|nr:hypothetical protein C0992_007387 [Termitomyces sp. T32_za158]